MFAERRARLRRPLRLLQPGRRPGRARLRRPELPARPRRGGARPGGAVRGGAAGLRRSRATERRAARRAAPRPRRGLRGAGARPARLRRARTASGTSASPSRAASTRPWSRCSRSTRSAPSGSRCVVMPSPHSSLKHRRTPGRSPRNLGAELIEIPIEPMMDGYEARSPAHRHPAAPTARRAAAARPGATLRARPRRREHPGADPRQPDDGALQPHGWLVLTTGNKSEMSVGYATLYGDMAGGFAVIKDVPKTLVYELVRHRNERAGPRAGARPR